EADEAENKADVASKAPEKKWKLVEKNADSEETITEQEAPAGDSPVEEAK
ncbi:MAG: hypothetical protein CG438_1574, partial [Methylococcaceae bacterium NSP1-1]